MDSGGRNYYDNVLDKMMRMWKFGNKEECKKALELSLEGLMEGGSASSDDA